MAYEQRDNSGSLFVNNRKEKDTHPDFNGTAMIDGVVYWISAWTKEGQKGDFWSLAFKRKEDQAAQEPKPQSISQRAMPKRPDPISTGRPLPIDDEIPF